MNVFSEILSVLSSFTCLLSFFSIIYCKGFERKKYFYLKLFILPFFVIFTTYNFFTINLKISKLINNFCNLIPFINTYSILNSFLCILIVKFLYKENWSNIIFIVIIAYISEHFCSHAKQLSAWIISGSAIKIPWYSMLIEIFIAITLAFIIKKLLNKYFDKMFIVKRKMKISFIILVIVALMGISSYVYTMVIFSLVTDLYEILISILLFFLLFSIFEYSAKEHSEIIISRLLDEQSKQICRSSKNIEFMDIKFHDLKKRIQGLEELIGKTNELEQIKNSISLYEANFDTGNNALNVVIREYAMTCSRKNIQFYCLANGNAISFLSIEDIYGLFHNALSNAIKATELCLENDRFVSIKVQQNHSIVKILIENSCIFSNINKKLETTKPDNIGHGFGIKSINHILEKYNSNLSISIKNNIFSLNIIFMLANNKLSN